MAVGSIMSIAAAGSGGLALSIPIAAGIGGALIAVVLIVCLASRELIGSSEKRSWVKVMSALDSMIVPLMIVFGLTVVWKIIEVVGGG